MTSRLRISSESGVLSGVAMLLLAAVFPAPCATVAGSIRLTDSKEAGGHQNHDFSGIVVWLSRLDGVAVPVQPKVAQMAQRKKHFVPPVLAVPVGSTVSFPNFDPIFHNAFSNFAGQVFDVGLYPPKTDQKVRFQRPGIVRVFCNIHPTMSAIIAVLDTPYMAVSNADGSFRIDRVEPGKYTLHVFHERAAEQTLKALDRNLTIGEEPVSVGALEISETGYLQTPHKNKYGQDYPAVIEDRPMYPAGRKP
jgi:plastocyanin